MKGSEGRNVFFFILVRNKATQYKSTKVLSTKEMQYGDRSVQDKAGHMLRGRDLGK